MIDIDINRTNSMNEITLTEPTTSQSITIALSTTDLYTLLNKVNTYINDELNQFSFLLNADEIIENVKLNINDTSLFSDEEIAKFKAFLAQPLERQYEQASDKLGYSAYSPGADIGDLTATVTGNAYCDLFGMEK